MKPFSCALALALTTTACVDADTDYDPASDAEFGQVEAGIVAGGTPYPWMVARAVKPAFPCTATLIAPRFAVTALHCTQYNKVGTWVHFYTDASEFDQGLAAKVVSVRTRPGTSAPPATDYLDTDDVFADIALLELETAAPASSTASTLEWAYPGAWGFGRVVGAGNHDDAGTNPNSEGELRYAVEATESTSDDSGHFGTIADVVNSGDSGGPLYLTDRVLGVLHGHVIGDSGFYTSVPEHLDWILGQIGYAWTHGASQAVVRRGTGLQIFDDATERTCQYACDHTACVAYDFVPSLERCTLLSSVTSIVSSTTTRSGAK
ncbi:MAG: trypsin-like serine protease [Deltaproteobacteria bacterium]|nr:trypsin-like serine protease [Deltaproteobacteria bacterium]